MPDLATPPDVGAWTAQRTEADTGTATETAPVPEAQAAAVSTTETVTTPEGGAPPVSTEPSAAEQVVAALVKGGMQAPDAQKLIESVQTPPAIKDALEAYLDGKPYPVPKNLTFKLQSGKDVQERTIDQIRRDGLREVDYDKKSKALAQERRQHQQQVAEWQARDAALKAREQWFEDNKKEMLEAQKDPQKWEQYQEVLRLRQANPAFNKLFEDAMRARESDASKDVFQKAMDEQEVQDRVAQTYSWIQEMGSEFPGVNPERVRVVLAYAISSGQLQDTQESVRRVYEGEMEYLKTGPAAQEAAVLKAKLDAYEAEKAAEAHNAKTDRALQRAKAPNTAPSGGQPAALNKVVERKPIPPVRQEIDKAISDWSKVRDE